MSGRLNALILDWGGVLTNPMDEAFASWMAREGVSRDSFTAVMNAFHNEAGSPLHQVEVGNLTQEEFEGALAAGLRTRSGGAVNPTGLLRRMFSELRPNQAMRELVGEVRALGWPTVVLSNSWGEGYDMPGVDDLVDVVLLSHRIGARKPQAEAFAQAVDAVAARAEDCVFVDDLRRNVRGAAQFGLRAHLYQPGLEARLRTELVDSDQHA